jgi:hypothetical protein
MRLTVSKELAKKLWDETFQKLIDEKAANSDTLPSEWRAGGRATKDYPDKENDIWWSEKGPDMVDTFIHWWKNSNWEVYYGNTKTPHIEAEYNVMFGSVPVKAFVDLIAIIPNEQELVVVDYKAGAYMPDYNMQLGLYACCMELAEGVRPDKGFFYNARKGIMEEAGDLSRWTIPVFTELFEQFERAVSEGIFLPNLGMSCKSCSVSQYCYAFGGELAAKYDPLASIDEEV